MLIELWRKVLATDYEGCACAVCGGDFDRGSVFAVAATDRGGEMGELCPPCLDYLSRRKDEAEDGRMRQNWPARDWPTLEDLEEARRRYPEPMFEDNDAFQEAAGYDPGREDEILQESFIWRMAPEKAWR